ncbi:RING/FYVE/PHD zinc finger-related protein [Corchorus olitorius]|uniref:RING/FYVE/PHD zinc finger-related protein n=1 Tax=Corchorus olitorius TaxID=93759 RepID=A0A1R3IAT0_9ROSI|nr:RING/FYVE/PHD zinc finger-related protein [Corchorus olitorius]
MNVSETNPPGTDLRDEALRRAKKNYKKRRSEASPDRGAMAEGVEQIDGTSTSPSTKDLTNVECSDPPVGNPNSSQATVPSSSPAYGPWMIVQRKTRRPAKEMVEQGKNKSLPNQGHESRNRFSSLQGIQDSSREKSKATVSEEAVAKSKEFFAEGRKVWKQKKDLGLKSHNKPTNKGVSKTIKNGVPSFSFQGDGQPSFIGVGPDLSNGPPPGFSFKAGSTKQITLDPKRLEDLIGSSHFGLSHLIDKQSTMNAGTGVLKDASSSLVSGKDGSDVEMCLPTDAESLPPQQPPTDFPAMDAQSKELGILDTPSSSVVNGVHPMQQ